MTLLKKNPQTNTADDDEIDLSELFAVLRENLCLIGIVTAIVFVPGALYAFLGTPVYRADAVIQVDDDSGMGSINDKLGDLASLFQSKATADAEIELIRSRTVVGETVDKLHVDIDARPHYFPLIGAPIARYRAQFSDGLLPPMLGMKSFAWGGERIGVAQFTVPAALYEKKFKLTALDDEAFELVDPDNNVVLRGRVGTIVNGRTEYGPITLKVTSLLAHAGARFDLKRFSTQLTVAELQKNLDIAEKTKQSGIIGMKLDGIDAQRVTAIVNMIASLYVQRNVDRKSAQAEQMLSFLGEQLPQLRADLDKAEARYNAFRAMSGAIDLDAQGKLLLQTVVDTQTRLTELQQQRADLVQRYTASHPMVAAVDARIAELERQQDQYEKQVTALPDTQQQALRLMRDVKVSTDLYMKLLDSTQQLRVLKAGQLGNVRTVDYAVVPEAPVRPLKLLVLPLALMLGLLLGCGLALARRMFNRGLETPAEIEHAVDIPVYAIISHSDKELALRQSVRRNPTRSAVLAAAYPDDVAVEGLRSLRTAMQFGLLKPENNIVMLTGPRPGVGKSFVSVNLATVLAATGKRILLIDADMRRGDVHVYFSINRKPGFSELLTGREAKDVIHHEALPNLDVVTSGSIPERPAELLVRERLGEMLKALAQTYDMVIIDSPPVLAVTDAVLIGKHAGATLMVVRHGRHSAAELRECTRQLASAGVDVDGLLLTDVPGRGTSYGAHSNYTRKSN
ncbi:polysaccharide biosynthesis tyrosine autokinase [Paraburkholderia sp. CNPSo 3281]|uniref:polysaccharide biosynthesis tyrosine autokinase n=1 Tax=Paraburkholderia sp. CNPSo 3281 TaxID=2940933 RepID=UPI0020B87377|nr:polysaccharide biosynthesis tyrosine autokinase [Paraburkholderia sp. CNPSo 3281]MCP3714157.1 polysaccharide biosynthesis tyrosine autokinase [Paraburkholderia sp. CNPSo 3281]